MSRPGSVNGKKPSNAGEESIAGIKNITCRCVSSADLVIVASQVAEHLTPQPFGGGRQRPGDKSTETSSPSGLLTDPGLPTL